MPLPLSLQLTHEAIVDCNRCPRLREYCEALGQTRRRAYQDQVYWSRPVPGFGDPDARIFILGLAPGAHGANRTGRPFTGDGSGAFMYPVLHALGLASQPSAVSRDDGLRLTDTWIASVVRCAPPGDKPLPEEIRNCSIHLANEIAALPRIRVVVCLGRIAGTRTLPTSCEPVSFSGARPTPLNMERSTCCPTIFILWAHTIRHFVIPTPGG